MKQTILDYIKERQSLYSDRDYNRKGIEKALSIIGELELVKRKIEESSTPKVSAEEIEKVIEKHYGGHGKSKINEDKFMHVKDVAAAIKELFASQYKPSPSQEDGEKVTANVILPKDAADFFKSKHPESYDRHGIVSTARCIELLEEYASQFKGKNLSDGEVERVAGNLAEALRVCLKSLATYGSHPLIEKGSDAALKEFTSLLNQKR